MRKSQPTNNLPWSHPSSDWNPHTPGDRRLGHPRPQYNISANSSPIAPSHNIPSRGTAFFEMRPDCHSGVHGYERNRERWIAQETSELSKLGKLVIADPVIGPNGMALMWVRDTSRPNNTRFSARMDTPQYTRRSSEIDEHTSGPELPASTRPPSSIPTRSSSNPPTARDFVQAARRRYRGDSSPDRMILDVSSGNEMDTNTVEEGLNVIIISDDESMDISMSSDGELVGSRGASQFKTPKSVYEDSGNRPSSPITSTPIKRMGFTKGGSLHQDRPIPTSSLSSIVLPPSVPTKPPLVWNERMIRPLPMHSPRSRTQLEPTHEQVSIPSRHSSNPRRPTPINVPGPRHPTAHASPIATPGARSKNHSSVLFIPRLPSGATENDLLRWLCDNLPSHLTPLNATIPERNTSIAFLQFSHESHALNAMHTLDGSEYQGTPIRLKIHRGDQAGSTGPQLINRPAWRPVATIDTIDTPSSSQVDGLSNTLKVQTRANRSSSYLDRDWSNNGDDASSSEDFSSDSDSTSEEGRPRFRTPDPSITPDHRSVSVRSTSENVGRGDSDYHVEPNSDEESSDDSRVDSTHIADHTDDPSVERDLSVELPTQGATAEGPRSGRLVRKLNEEQVELPKTSYNKARRILRMGNTLLCCSIRRDLFFIRRKSRRVAHSLTINDPRTSLDHVEDVCSLGDGLAVIGYSNSHFQASLVELVKGSRPKVIDLPRRPHTSPEKAVYQGITCLAPFVAHSSATEVHAQDKYFVSGGFDKSLFLWCLSKKSSSYKSRVPTKLVTSHTATIYAVACYPARGWVLSGGADARLVACDLEENQVLADETVQFEARNEVHQIHSGSSHGAMVFLEMKNHRQVLVFDVRRGFRNPVAKMGPAESLTTSEPAFKKSRYVRGSVKGHWFVRDEDLYDLRNTHQILRRTGVNKVAHSMFDDSSIIRYGRNIVSFYDYREWSS